MAAEVASVREALVKEVDEGWKEKLEQLRQSLMRDKQTAVTALEEQSRA